MLLFLRKLPKIYCKVQKRNRKLHWVHVHLVRNELSSVHVHFSLQKSDQHPIHECELNGKSSVPSPTMLSYTWLYIHFYFSHFMYLVNLAFDNQNFRQWTVRYKAIRHIFLSLREDPPIYIVWTGGCVNVHNYPIINAKISIFYI